MPAPFKLAFLALQMGGAVALLILLAVKGPTRGVKILGLAYVLISGAVFTAMTSSLIGLKIVAFSLGLGALMSSLAVLSWRVPVPRQLEPADPSAFPRHAWDEVRRRGEEATAAGLEWIGDRSYRYQIALQEGRGYQRFFATRDRTRWCYVHCMTGGRLVVCYVSGVTASGRCLRVAGGMDDFRFFPTPRVAVRMVSPRLSVQHAAGSRGLLLEARGDGRCDERSDLDARRDSRSLGAGSHRRRDAGSLGRCRQASAVQRAGSPAAPGDGLAAMTPNGRHGAWPA